ncbi:replication protein RepB [Enterococcus faecium]|nr:replication protein RepB [Enterococcus faecium]
MESYSNPSISIKELRIMTDTVNEYRQIYDFEKRVLKNAVEEITAYTSFNVTYEKVKKGRSIDSVIFHIDKKRRADDNSYKLEDTAFQVDKKQKEQSEAVLVKQAMESKYTRLLLDNMLLSPYEMTDTSLMAGLQAARVPSL